MGLNPGRGSAITGYRSLKLRDRDHYKPGLSGLPAKTHAAANSIGQALIVNIVTAAGASSTTDLDYKVRRNLVN